MVLLVSEFRYLCSNSLNAVYFHLYPSSLSPHLPSLVDPLPLLPAPRWLCFCHVPVQCESFPKYETTNVFGRTLLLSTSSVMRRHLMEKFMAEQDRMPPERKNVALNILPQ